MRIDRPVVPTAPPRSRIKLRRPVTTARSISLVPARSPTSTDMVEIGQSEVQSEIQGKVCGPG